MGLSDAFLRGDNPPALGLCVENGETLMLGGILLEDANDAKRKTPILGDVPLLERQFRRRMTRQDQQELLVFVTPTWVSRVSTDEPRGQPPDRSPSDTLVVDSLLKPQ